MARDRTRQALDAMTSSVTGDSLATQKAISDEQKKFLTEVLTYYQEFAGEKTTDEQSRSPNGGGGFSSGPHRGPPRAKCGSGGRLWTAWESGLRRPSTFGKPWRSRRSWPPSFLPSRSTAITWPKSKTAWGLSSPAWASGRMRSSSIGKPWRSRRSSSPSSPPCPSTATAWLAATTDFACFYAIASGNSADKNQEFADRAMDLLQKAVKAGYKDAEHMAEDKDLDPIRGRADFKKLIEELAAKQPG